MTRDCLRTPRASVAAGLAVYASLCSAPIQAQPLTLQVNPRGVTTEEIELGGAPASVSTLFEVGPRYTAANGFGRRVGIGSSVPSWIEMGSFRNQAVPGLTPSVAYGYFISPDDKAVLVDLETRRIVRVLSH